MKNLKFLYGLALAGLTTFSATARGAEARAVQTTHAKRGDVARNILLPAVVRADQETVLYAKVTGYVKVINVDIGDAVKKDQLLAVLEAPELAAERARYQAELAKAKADQKKAVAETTAAEIEFKRLQAASQKSPDLVVAQQVDDSKARRDVAKATEGMVIAEQNVASAKIKQTETLLAYAQITAPYAGVITKRWVDTGALVPAATASSSPVSSAVVTLADFSKVRVRVAVPQTEVPNIKNGIPAVITVDELPGRTFTGQVTRYAYALDDATKTMMAEVEIPNGDNALRPGMFSSVKLSVQTHTDTLTVPADALVVEKTKTSVFIVEGGKAKKVAVKVGFDDGKNTEVLDGLTPQQAVIVGGKQGLNDGDAVNATEAK